VATPAPRGMRDFYRHKVTGGSYTFCRLAPAARRRRAAAPAAGAPAALPAWPAVALPALNCEHARALLHNLRRIEAATACPV